MIRKGSLVKCIDHIVDDRKTVEKFPEKGCYYIVREVVVKDKKRVGYRLEEIINPVLEYGFGLNKTTIECFFDVHKFVEIFVEINFDKFLKECFGYRK